VFVCLSVCLSVGNYRDWVLQKISRCRLGYIGLTYWLAQDQKESIKRSSSWVGPDPHAGRWSFYFECFADVSIVISTLFLLFSLYCSALWLVDYLYFFLMESTHMPISAIYINCKLWFTHQQVWWSPTGKAYIKDYRRKSFQRRPITKADNNFKL